MPAKQSIPALAPDLQVAFYHRLRELRTIYLYTALTTTAAQIPVKQINDELDELVSPGDLQRLVSLGVRNEAFFPAPIILKVNPYLLGYYRLLLGFSQKEFYGKSGFGLFKAMEEKGRLTPVAEARLTDLCVSLIGSGSMLLNQIDKLTVDIIHDLQLLTLGPQLRGGLNNNFGQIAAQRVFSIIRELVNDYLVEEKSDSLTVKNSSGRLVTIAFAADPDLEITVQMPSGARGLVSIEVKGGRDYSNIHNRIGEAEKSHQKARLRGHREFITIINVEVDYAVLRAESPTTTHFFSLIQLSIPTSEEFGQFRDILHDVIGI
jgi:XcyI restriction endonuclease